MFAQQSYFKIALTREISFIVIINFQFVLNILFHCENFTILSYCGCQALTMKIT